jgi:hypothetical protein
LFTLFQPPVLTHFSRMLEALTVVHDNGCFSSTI